MKDGKEKMAFAPVGIIFVILGTMVADDDDGGGGCDDGSVSISE